MLFIKTKILFYRSMMSDNDDTMAESNSISEVKHRAGDKKNDTIDTLNPSNETQAHSTSKQECKPFELTSKHHEK